MATSTQSVTVHSTKAIGLTTLLTLLFVILKLNPGEHLTTTVVDWSWWWVLCPLWIMPAILSGFCVACLAGVLFIGVLGGILSVFKR